MTDAGLMGADKGNFEEVRSLDAGEVEVLPKNAVSLEDVDADEIPENEDVVIQPETKRMVLLGVKKKGLDEYDVGRSLNVQEVSRNVFDEIGEHSFENKYTYFFDFYGNESSLTTKIRYFLIACPFLVFLYFLEESSVEYFHAVNRSYLYEV